MKTIRQLGEIGRVLAMWACLLGIPVVLIATNGVKQYHPQLNTVLLLFITWVLLLRKDPA